MPGVLKTPHPFLTHHLFHTLTFPPQHHPRPSPAPQLSLSSTRVWMLLWWVVKQHLLAAISRHHRTNICFKPCFPSAPDMISAQSDISSLAEALVLQELRACLIALLLINAPQSWKKQFSKPQRITKEKTFPMVKSNSHWNPWKHFHWLQGELEQSLSRRQLINGWGCVSHLYIQPNLAAFSSEYCILSVVLMWGALSFCPLNTLMVTHLALCTGWWLQPAEHHHLPALCLNTSPSVPSCQHLLTSITCHHKNLFPLFWNSRSACERRRASESHAGL